MTDNFVVAPGSGTKHSPDAIQILDDLGEYINKTTALLRAAINTGAGEREDESCLVSLAHDEIEKGKRRYRELCGLGPEGDPR